jgi:hypothetical protein
MKPGRRMSGMMMVVSQTLGEVDELGRLGLDLALRMWMSMDVRLELLLESQGARGLKPTVEVDTVVGADPVG